jgi:hypothetical protein
VNPAEHPVAAAALAVVLAVVAVAFLIAGGALDPGDRE